MQQVLSATELQLLHGQPLTPDHNPYYVLHGRAPSTTLHIMLCRTQLNGSTMISIVVFLPGSSPAFCTLCNQKSEEKPGNETTQTQLHKIKVL